MKREVQIRPATRAIICMVLFLAAVPTIAAFDLLHQARPPDFAAPGVAAQARLFASPGTECSQFEDILSSPLLSGITVSILGLCEPNDPRRELWRHLRANQIAIVLDRSYPEAGASGEVSLDGIRKFLIVLNPERITHGTLSHELAHVRLGNTAIHRELLPHRMNNIVLDVSADWETLSMPERTVAVLVTLAATTLVFGCKLGAKRIAKALFARRIAVPFRIVIEAGSATHAPENVGFRLRMIVRGTQLMVCVSRKGRRGNSSRQRGELI